MAALLWLAAAAARLVGVRWGLPAVYNADEPHLVDLAVSFGGGSLRPYDFKYPTLWPYVLFVAFGLYFLVWSGLGLRRNVRQFAGLFAWHPGGFYLIARLLSAAASLGAPALLWRLEKRRHPERWPWAATILAFCPVVVDLAHSAKPDCFMLLCATLGWVAAVAVLETGGRRAHWVCGAAFGLAMSTQYTALPAALALPLASLLSPKRPSKRWLAEGALAAAAAFFAGSPYVLLDFHRFAASMRDQAALSTLGPWDRGAMLRAVAINFGAFGGAGSIAGLAALAGAVRLLKRERALAAVLLIPLAAYFVVLGNNAEGGWLRYLLGGFPALALLAAEGVTLPSSSGEALLLGALAVGPGLIGGAWTDAALIRPDTRARATAWIEAHVPRGSTLLLDEAHASPDAIMDREELERLYEKTKAAGSPRARLYRAMADFHPGGGYRILRVGRSAADLHSGPEHVARTQAETPTLDVRPGLEPARAERVDYVVTSSFGARPERAPELSRFFDELERDGRLVVTFAPEPGRVEGPVLRVYSLER